MKSTPDTRKDFKERISEALAVVKDSDELSDALSIVDDLENLLEVNALLAEYLYQVNLEQEYGDDDYNSTETYNLNKMREYLVHRLDLFLGIGVQGGVWKNSQHWIALQVEKMKAEAESKGMGFTEAHRAYGGSSSNPFSSITIQQIQQHIQNQQPKAPLPPPTPMKKVAPKAPAVTAQYQTELKDILNRATNNQLGLIIVTLKSNGSYELNTPKDTLYLFYSYVAQTVTLKDKQQKVYKVFKETDIQLIADFIKSKLL